MRERLKRSYSPVVGVQDRRLWNPLVDRFVKHLKQAALRRDVGRPAAVKVEVVATDRRDRGDIEFAAVQPVLGEAVRSRLQDRPVAPGSTISLSISWSSGDSGVVNRPVSRSGRSPILHSAVVIKPDDCPTPARCGL